MKPEIWGPHAWMFIHAISVQYPQSPSEDEKKAMIQFLESLQYLLPCTICSENYKKHLKLIDLHKAVRSKDNLIVALNDLHNMVNRINNKKVYSKVEHIMELNKQFTTMNNNHNIKKSNMLFVIIGILFISTIYFKRKYTVCRSASSEN
jgi:hypothetical protein